MRCMRRHGSAFNVEPKKIEVLVFAALCNSGFFEFEACTVFDIFWLLQQTLQERGVDNLSNGSALEPHTCDLLLEFAYCHTFAQPEVIALAITFIYWDTRKEYKVQQLRSLLVQISGGPAVRKAYVTKAAILNYLTAARGDGSSRALQAFFVGMRAGDQERIKHHLAKHIFGSINTFSAVSTHSSS
ncbi:hypothetical protein TGPRC2_231055 [Toxoplasma gondii TgCatPRC2]|uniref:Uncharacterized protein n=1 Tax=Toxoplasma gondii TgCatPRC2 TaxID=1130821 RepID=A0A151HDV9_TOXGO|nr:hypothetical protein TGPRC2_231055 [Toxoplasma gondii TgCatPRC2]